MELVKIAELKKDNEEKLKEIEVKTNLFSKIRIVLVVLAVIFLLCAVSLKQNLYYYLFAADCVIFLGVGLWFRPFFIKKKDFEIDNAVLDEYLYRGNGRWKQFSDNGAKFLKKDKEHDLDIFGKCSLYQFICSAKTPSGKDKLVNVLKNGAEDRDKSQEMVKKFTDLDTSIGFNKALKMYHKKSSAFTKDDLVSLESLANTEVKIDKKSIIGVCILPLFSISGICLAFVNIRLISLTILALVLQFCYTRIFFSKNEVFGYETSNITLGLKGYEALFNGISKMKKPLALEGIDRKSLRSFETICSAIASRRNIFAYLLGNMLFMDFFILLAMKKFTRNKLDSFFSALDTIASYEVYVSLANLNIVLDNTSYPVEGASFEVKNIRHPLLDSKAVGNDFILEGVVILTGSNMSGKTTFMRSLGLNYVLFMAGGPVVADSFSAPKLELFTSLRVNDMTTEGISTFYAELNRIHAIIEALKEGKKVFALVDEIFKGTNALDRLAGAERVVANLIDQYAIISTHDFELCKINGVLNYHFNEDYVDDKISFDYTIKKGQSKTTNGKYLMKSIGLE